MNYSNYFNRLSNIEERLFKEGYWKVGFVDSHGREIPIVTTTPKWGDMLRRLFDNKPAEKNYITEEMIITYLDNPKPLKKKYKSTHKIVKRVLKDGSIKEYEYNN